MLKRLGTTVAALAGPWPRPVAETAVKALWDTLSAAQRMEICFDWDYRDAQRGLVRSFVANHWQVTRPNIRSAFFTRKQQSLIHDIYKGLLSPEWYPRFLRQLKEDTFGHEWGANQSVAIFGTPGGDRFEFVITGRHMTLRADGHTEGRVAFGGPILYGHAPSFSEGERHPGNIFWPQAVEANKVYAMLDPPQRARTLVAVRPAEEAIEFRGAAGTFAGIPVAELNADQTRQLRRTLLCLLEPFRQEDRDRVEECLRQQGGLERCHLAFYEEGSLGGGLWDNWRLEGPAFVWYFRGTPHVHTWVHVANDPAVTCHARNGAFLHPEHDRLGALDVTLTH